MKLPFLPLEATEEISQLEKDHRVHEALVWLSAFKMAGFLGLADIQQAKSFTTMEKQERGETLNSRSGTKALGSQGP